MEVFPAFALPMIRTRNLIFGSRGRSGCAAIVTKSWKKDAASRNEAEVLSLFVYSCVDGNMSVILLMTGLDAHLDSGTGSIV